MNYFNVRVITSMDAGTLTAKAVIDNLKHTMNTNCHYHLPYPDHLCVPSELVFRNGWDGEAVSELIRSKSNHGAGPAFLFLGRREAGMLREHLADAFGEDSVTSLNGTYYKGLHIVTVACESFLAMGGRKVARGVDAVDSRRAGWRDLDSTSLWQLRI